MQVSQAIFPATGRVSSCIDINSRISYFTSHCMGDRIYLFLTSQMRFPNKRILKAWI